MKDRSNLVLSDQEKSSSRSSLLEKHPVTAFFILAFLISWGGVFAITLPAGFPGQGETVDRLYGLVFLPMLAGPFLSALFLSTVLGGRNGVAALLPRLFIWHAGLFEYVVSFALIPACALTVLLSLSMVSPEFQPGFLASDSGFAALAPMLMLGIAVGFIEETGWTSFATSRLLHGRGVLTVAVSLGIVHGLWHLPVVVWASGEEYGAAIAPFFLTLWILALVTMRILAVWIFARTGSTFLAAVAHASHSGWLFVLWPLATTPVQDVIWTAAFATVGLATALTVYLFAPARSLKTGSSD